MPERTFLECAEQIMAQERPDGMRIYEVDGHSIFARPEFVEYLQQLADRVQNFIDGMPHIENLGDNQDAVETLCRETGLLKPCYGEWCCGCDEPDEDCANGGSEITERDDA